MEDEAMKYVNLIIEKGMKIKWALLRCVTPRFRNYLPLLQSISERGGIASMRRVIAHMREHAIPFDENVYYFEMKTCTLLALLSE